MAAVQPATYLFAGGLEREGGQVAGHPIGLRQLQEHARAQEAQLGVMPGSRASAPARAATGLHLGLVIQAQLTLVQGAAQGSPATSLRSGCAAVRPEKNS